MESTHENIMKGNSALPMVPKMKIKITIKIKKITKFVKRLLKPKK